MSEQRVMKNTGAGAAGGAAGAGGGDAPAAGAKRKRLLLVVVAVLVAAAAGWWFLAPHGSAEAEAEPAPEPGEVFELEAISVNLADGHYLKVGLALEMTAEAGAHGEPSGSKAQDVAIDLFSGRQMAELSDPVRREELQAELTKKISDKYHHEVLHVYYHEYVMQ